MNRIAHRGLRALLLVTLAAASIASTAYADRGDYRGPYGPRPYRHGVRYGVRYGAGYPVIVERHSSAGPALFGFLGGLVLGSVLTNAHHAAAAPPPPQSVYEYYDPYCRERFSSFDQYENHLRYQDHPSVLEVRDSRDGRCVDRYAWQDGRWSDDQYQRDRGQNWNDDRDRSWNDDYRDRGWNDDRDRGRDQAQPADPDQDGDGGGY